MFQRAERHAGRSARDFFRRVMKAMGAQRHTISSSARVWRGVGAAVALGLAVLGARCGGSGSAASVPGDVAAAPPAPALRGESVSLMLFDNPYAYIPA
jgi:hypothetical protein